VDAEPGVRRLVHGAPAAKFLQYVKGLIEEPYLLLAE